MKQEKHRGAVFGYDRATISGRNSAISNSSYFFKHIDDYMITIQVPLQSGLLDVGDLR